MEVHLDSGEAAMARRDRKGKRRRRRAAPRRRQRKSPLGPAKSWPSGRPNGSRPARDPASFAVVEREVHDQARHQADLYVAGLLAKASERPEMAEHIAGATAATEVPLRPIEKKQRLDRRLEIETVASFLEFFRPRTGLMQGLRGLCAIGRLLIPLHVQGDTLANVFSRPH